jgi:4-amino-4-deoxy-L-arabinose transferase-like glycosyltransferase
MTLPATAPIANPAHSKPWRRRAPRVQPVRVIGREPGVLGRRLERGPVLTIEQPWRTQRRLRIRLATLLPVLLFLFSLYQNLGNMDTVDFHRDEARWINRAHFLEALRDPFGQTWGDYYSTRGQPPLGNYLMGIGLLIQGRDLDTNRVWDFNYDEEWNTRAGAMPELGDLNAGRRTNAVIGAFVVLCVYALASRLMNRVGGIAAGLFLSVHPLHLRLSSQALSDELLALLIALSFLTAYRFATRPSIGWGLALGALLGLGGAAKLSPLLLSLPLAAFGAAWLVWALLRNGRSGIRWNRARFGWMLLFQPAIAFLVFVAANPFLWSNPLRLTWELFDFRRTEMDGQSTAWPIAHVDGPLSALMRIGRRLNTDYSSSIRIEKYIEQTASVSVRHVSIDVVLMAAGLIALLAIVIRRGLWSAPSLTAYLMASQAATVVVGMGVDFYRYFLPVLIVGSVCLGVGAGAAWQMIRPRLLGLRPKPVQRRRMDRQFSVRGTIQASRS